MKPNVKHILYTFFTVGLLFQAPPSRAEILWDNWYIESDEGVPRSYYNEKVEIKGDKAKIQVNRWIKEGTKIRSENLGATAKNTSLLEPLLYNYRTQENGMEKTIDGSILNNGKVFSVKLKKGIDETKPLRAEMLPKLILSSFFPVWINKNYKRITGVQPIEYKAILEDQVDKEVPVVEGTAYEMLQDDVSKQTHTRKLRIQFGRFVMFWYVTPKGDATEILVPSVNKVVKKTDRATAEKFLTP